MVLQDKAGNIELVKLEDGATVTLDRNPSAPRTASISFSHDSRWIAWSRSCDETELDAIYLHDTKAPDAAQARTMVTSGFYSDSNPTFDRKGDWLVFTSDRNFSPAYSEFDTTWIYNNSQVLMAVPLKKDFKLPWLPASDEEGQKDEKKDDKKDEKNGDKKSEKDGEGAKRGDAAASSGASGSWNCVVRIDNAPIAVKLALTETNGAVKGTATSIMGSADLTGTYDAATGALKL